MGGAGPGPTHLMRFSKNNRALLKTCKRERDTTPSPLAPEQPPQLLPAPVGPSSSLHPAGPALPDLTPSSKTRQPPRRRQRRGGKPLGTAPGTPTGAAPTPGISQMPVSSAADRDPCRPAARTHPTELVRAPRPQQQSQSPSLPDGATTHAQGAALPVRPVLAEPGCVAGAAPGVPTPCGPES